VGKPKPGTGANGVHCVEAGEEAIFLSRFRLSDLPMVGPKFADTLARRGLETVAEAQARPRDALIASLGERAGHWLYQRIRGIDDSAVSPRETQKQVSREETFAQDLHDDALIARELSSFGTRTFARGRRSERCAPRSSRSGRWRRRRTRCWRNCARGDGWA
jgi:DNA polymerase IV